jgi:hypothetical protein
MAALAYGIAGYGAYRQSKQRPKATPAIPMPDEEELRRSRRKALARQSVGRASTILTETDGLGG